MKTNRALLAGYLSLFVLSSGARIPQAFSDGAVGLSPRMSEDQTNVQISGLKVDLDSLKMIRSSQEVEGTFKFEGKFQHPSWILLQGKNIIKPDSKGNFKVSLPFSSLETEIEFAAVGPLGELETKTYLVELSVDLTP